MRSSLLTGLDEVSSARDRRYSGVDLATDFCPYHIKVYPSDEMRSDYVSSNPILFSMVAVSIFLFTSLVFLVYDNLTRARQQRILQSALQNSALVSSLFPTSFRDRVLVSQRTAGGGEGNNSTRSTGYGPLQSFLVRHYNNGSTSDIQRESGPIAEYFEEATISKF